jgi:hypothetical protein
MAGISSVRPSFLTSFQSRPRFSHRRKTGRFRLGRSLCSGPDVRDAVQYIFEFENESAHPEQSFTLNLPAGVTSFEVPAALVVADSEYQVGVGSVHENGNVVFVEVQFSTAE